MTVTTARHREKSQSWGQLSSKYTKSFDSATGKRLSSIHIHKHQSPEYQQARIPCAPWNQDRYQDLQFPRPPQPLLMMPLCPVISNAFTIISVIFSGSSTGLIWIENKNEYVAIKKMEINIWYERWVFRVKNWKDIRDKQLIYIKMLLLSNHLYCSNRYILILQ